MEKVFIFDPINPFLNIGEKVVFEKIDGKKRKRSEPIIKANGKIMAREDAEKILAQHQVIRNNYAKASKDLQEMNLDLN